MTSIPAGSRVCSSATRGSARRCSSASTTTSWSRSPSAPRSPSSAAFVGRTIDRQLVFRDLSVGRGMRVDLRVRNLAGAHREVEVALRMDTDLAGLFEVKTRSVIVPPVPGAPRGPRSGSPTPTDIAASTAIGSEGAAAGEDGTIRWRVPAGRRPGVVGGASSSAPLRGGRDVASAVSCDAPLAGAEGHRADGRDTAPMPSPTSRASPRAIRRAARTSGRCGSSTRTTPRTCSSPPGRPGT